VNVVFNDRDVTLYQGDAAEVMDGLRFLVDAIVTSPPYLDARNDVVSPTSPLEYADWVQGWLWRAQQVLSSRGSLMLNLGRLHRDGMEIDLAGLVRRHAQAQGWLWLDTLIWHKVNGGGGKQTPYLLDRHEYVLWLAKRRDPYKGFEEARQPYSPATLARYRRNWGPHGGVVKNKPNEPHRERSPHPAGALPGSVFTSSVGAEKGIKHPTPMALDLALHLIRLSCPPGGIVLDPFAGSGTTGLAARMLGRRAILIELDATHCAEAAARLGQQTLDLNPPGDGEDEQDDHEDHDDEQPDGHAGAIPDLAERETAG
jgi:DNA modification methylase